MIELSNVSKSFGKIQALDNANCTIEKGSVFGLVGSNGAGKSTLFRIIAGIYKQDGGSILFDGQKIFDNPSIKKQCVFVSDSPYIATGATIESMAKMYSAFYDTFSYQEYNKLVNLFNLNPKSQLSDFSKGMRRQANILLALSCQSKYIIMDETLDGLDPVMRSLVKKLLYQSVMDHGTTVILSSHSLRELEDACDNLAMIHSGKIIFQKDIQSISSSVNKIQIVMDDELNKKDFGEIDVLSYTRRGSVSNLIIRGDCNKAVRILEEKEPILIEVLPLSLEEIFTYELKEKGYSFDETIENGGNEYEKEN